MFAIAFVLLGADPEVVAGCGAVCVHLLAREMGNPFTLDAAVARLPDSEEGRSFDELKATLSELGVQTQLTNLRSKGLAVPRGPFIALLSRSDKEGPGHFVFLRPLEPSFSQYQLVGPGSDPEVLFAHEFLRRRDFTGWVLAPRGPNLALYAGLALLIFGLVLVIATLRIEFLFRGNSKLSVSDTVARRA